MKGVEVNPRLQQLTERYPDVAACAGDMQKAFDVWSQAYREGGKALICGNGGSAADSDHIVGELMKGFMSTRPIPGSVRQQLTREFPEDAGYLADHLQGALPAISLASQQALMTAYSNDVAPDMVFAQQVYGYGVRGDIVIGLSTSGTSRNIVHALQVGRSLGLRTIGFTGESGGVLRSICDVTVRVPSSDTMHIQERHFPMYHALCLMLEDEFFPS